MVEQGTHKPLVGSPNLPLGTKQDIKVLPVYGGLIRFEATFFFIWGSLYEGDHHICFKNTRPGAYHIFPGIKRYKLGDFFDRAECQISLAFLLLKI